MKKILSIIILLGISSPLFSSVHLISDIDDTIKRSHILGSKLRALKTTNSFAGFRELYLSALCYQGGGIPCLADYKQTPNTQISYISAQHKFLSFIARTFLKKTKFPEGEYLFRNSIFTPSDVFKFEAISKSILKVDADTTVMMGDNGEMDVAAYAQISNHFNNKEIVSFIHQVYATEGSYKDIGVKLDPQQIGYLTAIDLGLEFVKKDLISKKDFKIIVDLVIKKLTNLKTIHEVIPSWVRCHEFTAKYKIPFVLLDPVTYAKVITAQAGIKLRCNSLMKKP